MPANESKKDLDFRRPGGVPGSYRGSPFNQFKHLSRGMIEKSFRYERFKAFLEEFYERIAAGEDIPDLAHEIFPVLVREGLIPPTTYQTDIARWLHDYSVYRRGEAEFECPPQIP